TCLPTATISPSRTTRVPCSISSSGEMTSLALTMAKVVGSNPELRCTCAGAAGENAPHITATNANRPIWRKVRDRQETHERSGIKGIEITRKESGRQKDRCILSKLTDGGARCQNQRSY